MINYIIPTMLYIQARCHAQTDQLWKRMARKERACSSCFKDTKCTCLMLVLDEGTVVMLSRWDEISCNRENYLKNLSSDCKFASLVELWLVFQRVWSSHGSHFGEFGRATVRILASLVELWFVFWRVWSSYGSYFGEFGRAKIPVAWYAAEAY